MHPVRRFILFRWVLYLAVVAGILIFVLAQQRPAPKFSSDVMKRLAPKKVQAPDAEVSNILNSAVAVLRGERVPFGGVDRIEPSLIALHEDVTATGQKKLAVNLSVVFLGPPKKYAIINGAVYGIGEKLPDGREVRDIQADGVVLAVGGVEERYDWVPSFRVELKKADVKKVSVSVEAGGQPTAQTGTPSPEATPADLDNLPENPTPDQAMNILQQLRKQQGQKK